MSEKYLAMVNGVPTQKEAESASLGVSSAGKIVALNPQGKIDGTMMPTGIGADVALIVSSENLAAGDFVNIWSDDGTAKVRKADASAAGKEAHGFVLSACTAGTTATVYFEGTNDQVTGQEPGRAFLSSSVPGAATKVPPSGIGQVVQCVGIAIGQTAINAEIGQHYIL